MAERRAVLLTAFDRPHYLGAVLDAWADVRGLDGWHLRVAVEPSGAQDEVVDLVEAFVRRTGHPSTEVVLNPTRLGVLENPYVHLDALFADGQDFVVRAEDDLLVADDVLELFDHVAEAYAADPRVATAHAFSRAPVGGAADALVRAPEFCPWVFGTWRDRWDGLLGPTWDRDYSTWNVSPGFETGFDWNLNTRVFPAHGLVSVSPAVSRVQNIGAVGEHGTPEDLETAASFVPHQRPTAYREAAQVP
ncbi:glycosyltransferase family protein [Microlunatus flavus]|uniref:Glycosyl transferase family 2 n=1 Tax=Microlunatus flavus TaxID=1036181 RepID=A0A1H9HH19_9ACTN|nr:hypothetical protein [Microlunatus flavus]SEQ61516.1 hypothetical protein SAMN05421756_104247 [Microlunatus flavus]